MKKSGTGKDGAIGSRMGCLKRTGGIVYFRPNKTTDCWVPYLYSTPTTIPLLSANTCESPNKANLSNIPSVQAQMTAHYSGQVQLAQSGRELCGKAKGFNPSDTAIYGFMIERGLILLFFLLFAFLKAR